MAEHRTIIGTYGTHEKAEAIASELQREGFSAGQIDLIDEETGARDMNGQLIEKLRSWGLPEDDASSYADSVHRGEALVALDVEEDEVTKAVRVMRADQGIGQTTARTGEEHEELEGSYPVVEEEVHVGKERIRTGGVRVVPRVEERPVEEDVRLREERVHVEREPTNRPVTAADMDKLGKGGIELSETEERAVVDKSARVVEEVRVGKDVEEHTEHVSDTARRQDVDVERDDRNRGPRGSGQPGL